MLTLFFYFPYNLLLSTYTDLKNVDKYFKHANEFKKN